MTLFDLLLILLVLGTASGLVAALVALALHRSIVTRTIVLTLVLVWAAYLGVGTLVALKTPQHIMAVGEDRCFDEMCFAVTGFHRAATIEGAGAPTKPQGVFLVIDVRASNRGGHAQRENGRKGVVIDQSGRVYEVSQAGMRALAAAGAVSGLDAKVGPGESIDIKLVFDIPADAPHPAFALASGLGFNPATIVIADEAHFLHKPTVVPLD